MRKVFGLCALLSLLCFSACSDLISTIPPDARRDGSITGIVNATEIDVASKVPGRILKIVVKEGDKVEQGQDLLELNLDELDAKLLQATSAIDAAKAQLALAHMGARPQEIRALQKQVASAKAQVDIAQKMYDRSSKLLADGALPLTKFEEVEFKYSVSVNQLDMAEAKLEATVKGARSEEIKALEALVARGEAVVDEIEIYKREIVQKAPIKGEIAKIILHAGELTNTGYPILTIVDLDDLWVSFAVREDRLKDVRVGDIYPVYLPALDRTVSMKVSQIATMADFATWRATSDRDSFDLKSFEVKLRPLDAVEGIRPGMTARWSIHKPESKP